MSFVLWSVWISGGIVVLLLALLFLGVWMAKEYFSLPGHYPVSQGLVGQVGTAKTDLSPHQRGKVYVAGAYWDGVSEYGTIHAGKDVQVVEFREKFLVVKPVDLTGQEEPSQKQ